MSEARYCAVADKICRCDQRCEDTDEPPRENSDYCECGAVHSGTEDGGRCQACGKVI